MSEAPHVPDQDGSAFSPQGLPSEKERLGYQPPDPLDVLKHIEASLKQKEATTAQYLAYIIVLMLFASVVGHYALMGFFVWQGRGDATATFEHIFNAWLPVVSGLASAAATYYFTKDRK
jgi:hypothetical protein